MSNQLQSLHSASCQSMVRNAAFSVLWRDSTLCAVVFHEAIKPCMRQIITLFKDHYSSTRRYAVLAIDKLSEHGRSYWVFCYVTRLNSMQQYSTNLWNTVCLKSSSYSRTLIVMSNPLQSLSSASCLSMVSRVLHSLLFPKLDSTCSGIPCSLVASHSDLIGPSGH